MLYRHANALSNLLEYPVWIASGLLFSIVAPARLDAADLVGARRRTGASLAIRHAALGGDVWFPLAMVLALGLACAR